MPIMPLEAADATIVAFVACDVAFSVSLLKRKGHPIVRFGERPARDVPRRSKALRRFRAKASSGRFSD